MQPTTPDLAEQFRHFVRNPDFPCVGAKSALSREQMHIEIARDITSAWDDMRIWPALYRLAQSYREDPKLFQTLVVIFEQPLSLTEDAFEQALWARVQSISDKDEWLGQTSDPRVSSDPADPHFSLSFGGEAFFVVGLHPQASRPARRFAHPALAFNLHDQFEQLRGLGRYDKLRESIILRDVAIAGSVNPMLARHGEMSEARQYSGRAVDPSWQCPFSRRNAGELDAV
jgi:uncharacterized protein